MGAGYEVDENLLKILSETNEKNGSLVEGEIIEKIFALVVLNPLPQDRKRCQNQIKELILQEDWEEGFN